MLVLLRKPGEKIHIGDNITVTVVRFRNGGVRLGIEAPDDVLIRREELLPPAAENDEPRFGVERFKEVTPMGQTATSYEQGRIAKLTRERNQLRGTIGSVETVFGFRPGARELTYENLCMISEVIERAIIVRDQWGALGGDSDTFFDAIDELSKAVTAMEGGE